MFNKDLLVCINSPFISLLSFFSDEMETVTDEIGTVTDEIGTVSDEFKGVTEKSNLRQNAYYCRLCLQVCGTVSALFELDTDPLGHRA